MDTIDDASPLVRPIKEAFYEHAYVHAARLQAEVDAGRLSSAEAHKQLVETMQQPHMLAAVLEASQAGDTSH